jgi:hypothetical protein
MARPWEERHAYAVGQVEGVRRVIDRQRRVIALKKAQGHDTAASEDLLQEFERSQAIFERELADICGERT